VEFHNGGSAGSRANAAAVTRSWTESSECLRRGQLDRPDALAGSSTDSVAGSITSSIAGSIDSFPETRDVDRRAV
jgi:hypothetical protein